MFTVNGKVKKGVRNIGGTSYNYDSGFEANYARWLEFLKRVEFCNVWQREPEQFKFYGEDFVNPVTKRKLKGVSHGTMVYTPDFYSEERDDKKSPWVKWYTETKGYLSPKDYTKLSRFRTYYPQHKLRLVLMRRKKAGSKESVRVDALIKQGVQVKYWCDIMPTVQHLIQFEGNKNAYQGRYRNRKRKY